MAVFWIPFFVSYIIVFGMAALRTLILDLIIDVSFAARRRTQLYAGAPARAAHPTMLARDAPPCLVHRK